MPSTTSAGGDDERARLARGLASALLAMEATTLPAAVRSLVETDLTIVQLRVLTRLVTAPGGMTVSGLRSASGVSMASTSTMVARLVAHGAAERVADDDARVRRVRATPAGQDVVHRLVAARPEYADEVVARLELEDLRALERGMRAVAVVLAADAASG